MKIIGFSAGVIGRDSNVDRMVKAIMEKTRHSNIEVLAKHYISDEESAAPYFDKVLGV